jgi:hypothetical protein
VIDLAGYVKPGETTITRITRMATMTMTRHRAHDGGAP